MQIYGVVVAVVVVVAQAHDLRRSEKIFNESQFPVIGLLENLLKQLLGLVGYIYQLISGASSKNNS